MYEVKGKTIVMTRGDTLMVKITILRDGEEYTPQEGDSVRFAVKSKLNSTQTEFVDANPLINKTIPNDTLILRLDPNDTKSLPFGDYTYDIEITFSDGVVDTFIANSKFSLKPEVH